MIRSQRLVRLIRVQWVVRCTWQAVSVKAVSHLVIAMPHLVIAVSHLVIALSHLVITLSHLLIAVSHLVKAVSHQRSIPSFMTVSSPADSQKIANEITQDFPFLYIIKCEEVLLCFTITNCAWLSDVYTIKDSVFLWFSYWQSCLNNF